MRAVVRELRSLELEDELANYRPNEVQRFGTWIRILVGPENESGSDSFELLVCSPDWLKATNGDNPVWGRHMLILGTYDFERIRDEIVRHVESCTGSNWAEIVEKLSRVAAWEFEDYKPAAGSSRS